MKKYDLYIVGIYVIFLVVSLGSIFITYNNAAKNQDYVNELYSNPSVSSVVINNVEQEVIVAKVDNVAGSRDDWQISGYVWASQIKRIKIENDVLYIDGVDLRGNRPTIILVDKDIPVEINNSPKVQIMNEEEFKIYQQTQKEKNEF